LFCSRVRKMKELLSPGHQEGLYSSLFDWNRGVNPNARLVPLHFSASRRRMKGKNLFAKFGG
jgi:hypothetical protein